MRIALAGAGVIGMQHLDALATMEAVSVTSVISRTLAQAKAVAATYDAVHASTDLNDALARDDVDAVILCTPTPLHADQAIATMKAGKHVQVALPVADSWADALAVQQIATDTGLVCMVGHKRRFDAPHAWMHERVAAGTMTIQQMVAQTYSRHHPGRNKLNQNSTSTDYLLWHEAAHAVDLFHHQTGSPITLAHAIAGPPDPELGIATDLSVQLRTETGQICTLAVSFNNDGPLGTSVRYLCDNGTYVACGDHLTTGQGEPVDLSAVASSGNGIERQDSEFIAAIREGRHPQSSIDAVLESYRVLGQLETHLTPPN